MPRNIFVSFLPSLVDASLLPEAMVVVIDTLRASSTVAGALAAGAKQVIPLASVDEARRLAERFKAQGETPLLGGERGGERIEGFDLGNSPFEYTPEAVADRTILFTTTNGTRALAAVGNADFIGMGSFMNLSATVKRLAKGIGDIHLVCAGTDGQITFEDVLAAGAIAGGLRDHLGRDAVEWGNDQTKIALDQDNHFGGEEARLREMLDSIGGRNLVKLGLEEDVELCARIDMVETFPVLQNGVLVREKTAPPQSDDTDWSI